MEAVAHQSHFYELGERRLFDTVVASCGGFPKDINLIQAHKTIHNAAAWVRDGGRLFVLACCSDGVGSKTLLPWFDYPSFEAAFAELAVRYEGNGGTALALMQKTARIGITLVTSLDASVCRAIGVGRLDPENLAQALKEVGGTIAIIPNGAMVVKRALSATMTQD
jgi:nickel-dependent lactate racemase